MTPLVSNRIIRAGRLGTAANPANGVQNHPIMEEIFLDPGAITSASWSELGSLLRSMWLAVLFVVIFATNMLLGHNLIPSFIASGHIGENWRKARPVLYGGAVVSIVVAGVFIWRAAVFAGVLRDFWPDYWI